MNLASRPQIDLNIERGIKIDPRAVSLQLKNTNFKIDPDNVGNNLIPLVKDMEGTFVADSLEDFNLCLARIVAVSVVLMSMGLPMAVISQKIFDFLNESSTIPQNLVMGIMNSLSQQTLRFVEKTNVDEENDRERLGSFLRSLNTKKLRFFIKSVLSMPRLRKKMLTDKNFKKALTEGTYKQGEDLNMDGFETKSIGELHKILTPLFSKLIQDRELRYYLNLAIDEAANEKSDSIKAAIDAAGENCYFIPVVIIGAGVYAQVINNEIMHAAPELSESSFLTMDANGWIGGQFAVGNRAVFSVNNRVRPQKGKRARPGTSDNIMPLGPHAVVDLSGVTSKTYPGQNLLGAALKTNEFLNTSNCLVNSKATGVRKNNDTKKRGKYIISFVDQITNRSYEIYTDRGVVTDGLGEARFGFDDKFDSETREIVAEARQQLARKEKALYYTAPDLAAIASAESDYNWHELFRGEGVLFGDGDFAITSAAAILGYGPEEEGNTQSDFVKNLAWIGQPARNGDEWCELARPRYADIAREFPRIIEGEEEKVPDDEIFEGCRIFNSNLKKVLSAAREAEKLGNDIGRIRELREILLRYRLDGIIRIDNGGFDNLKNQLLDMRLKYQDEELDARKQTREKLNICKANLVQLNLILRCTETEQSNELLESVKRDICSATDGLKTFDIAVLFPDLNEFRRIRLSSNEFFPANTLIKIKARTQVAIERLEKEIQQTEELLQPVESVKKTDTTSVEPERFFRIKPIGLPPEVSKTGPLVRPANTTKDGKKIGRALRAKKEIVEVDGKPLEKIRIFYIDAKGKEESVLADWAIDATGFVSKTAELFVDFDRQPEDLEEYTQANPNNIASLKRSILEFAADGNKNQFLNGLIIENLEFIIDQPTAKFYTKIKVKTRNSTEYIYEVVGQFVGQQAEVEANVISSNTSLEAQRIAQALKIWLQRPEVGALKKFTVNKTVNNKTFGDSGEFSTVSLTTSNPEILMPVAAQLKYKGKTEDLFFAGPTNRFALTDEEKKKIPALSAVTANLASMFRYVPAVADFATSILVRDLKKQQQPFALESERYRGLKIAKMLKITGANAIQTLEEKSAKALFKGTVKKEISKLPTVADPQVIFAYCIEKAGPLKGLGNFANLLLETTPTGVVYKIEPEVLPIDQAVDLPPLVSQANAEAKADLNASILARAMQDPLFLSALAELIPANPNTGIVQHIQIDLNKKTITNIKVVKKGSPKLQTTSS